MKRDIPDPQYDTLRQRVEAKIKDAYYDARHNGGTMDTAAIDAADAVMTIIAKEYERLAKSVEQLPGSDGEGVARWPSRHADIYMLAIEEAAARVRNGGIEE